MRQLSQQRILAKSLGEIEERARTAVNRVLEREYEVRNCATKEIWLNLLREFRRTSRQTHDLVEYGRSLERYAYDKLYFAALLLKRERQRWRKPKADGKPFVRQKSRSRNIEIAWFVVERLVPFWQLFSGEKLLFGHHGPRTGIPWESAAHEWNLSHSHDRFEPGKSRTRGNIFKDEYYRARRRLEPELLKKFSDSLLEVLLELVRQGDDFGREVHESASAKHRELLAKQRLSRKPLENWTIADEVEWREWRDRETRRFRDALTLKELIQHHLWKAKMRTVSGSQPSRSYHDVPLRPWFLAEVLEPDGGRALLSDAALNSLDPLTRVFLLAGGPGWV